MLQTLIHYLLLRVDINSDTITEGSTNLFTTAARTRSHISVGGDLAYNCDTGVISFTEFDTLMLR